MQVGSTLVLNLANPLNFSVVVKNLGRKKVELTREQQAYDQAPHPKVLPIFSPASHYGSALFWFGLNLQVSPADANNTK